MVAFSHHPRLTFRIAPCGAVLAALLAVATCLLLPAAWLESLVLRSGVPSLLTAAEPPLGHTARVALALAAGGAGALITWAALFVLVGGRKLRVRVPVLVKRVGPTVRRADAHPDAPPRAPILADRDFGAPFLDAPSPEAERPLPADLATPLAAYAPEAIPREPVRPPAPIARAAPLDPGERIETFALSHDVPPEHAHSIESLLARLEQGARARGLVQRAPSDAPLGTFGRLAS